MFFGITYSQLLYFLIYNLSYFIISYTNFAQDRVAWAALVNHVVHMTKLQWVKKDGERKGREVPWSHTPIIRVSADDIRVPRRAAVASRLLTFGEVGAAEGEEQ